MNTVFSLYIASLKEFVRDRMALFWTFAFPIVFIVLFGLIFSGNGSPSYTVGLVNQDSGPLGATIAQVFGQVKSFTIKTGDQDHELAQLRAGNLDMVVVIPANLSANSQNNTSTPIQVYYDQSKGTDAQIELGIVQAMLTQFNQHLTQVNPPLTLAPQGIVAHSLSSIDFLVPGILAMALMQLGIFGTAQPLVSLREQQILRRLGATPLPRWQWLLSQVFNRLTLAAVQTGLIVAIGALAFKVQIVHPWELAGLALLGAVMFISLGYLIAALAKTQDSVNGISQAINFPMMFLSGIFFPLALLPAFLTPVVRALPLTYLADAMRQVMIDGTPTFPLMTDLLIVAGWVVACTAIAIWRFRWE